MPQYTCHTHLYDVTELLLLMYNCFNKFYSEINSLYRASLVLLVCVMLFTFKALPTNDNDCNYHIQVVEIF